MKPYINLLDVCQSGTRTLGPGLRYAIWTQGCLFNCKGCATPEGIPIVANKITYVEDIVASICANPYLDGITISGGEPFLQASKLTMLLDDVMKKRPILNVIVFSGYQKQELIWPEAKALLSQIDVLIDGKYVDRLNDNIGLRGSSNQQIHYLTNRLSAHNDLFEHRERSLEMHLFDRGYVTVGVPNNNVSI